MPPRRPLRYRQYAKNIALKERIKEHNQAMKTEVLYPKDFAAELAYRDYLIEQAMQETNRVLNFLQKDNTNEKR